MVQTATLPLMLKQLRLSSIARHWQGFLDKAERNGWDSAQYLTALCEQELDERYSRRIARYGKESHLPVGKTLASFDFAQVPGLARAQIEALALAGCEGSDGAPGQPGLPVKRDGLALRVSRSARSVSAVTWVRMAA